MPSWVPLLAKTGALFAVILAFIIGVAASIAYQLSVGYTSLETACICAPRCWIPCPSHWRP